MNDLILSPETTATMQPPDSCAELARSPRILNRVAEALHVRGVVGEERAIKLLCLALTTRFLKRPVSAVMKGPSSAGKSYLVEQVLSLFPPDAYYALTAMSDRALAYDDHPLKHRFLVIYEAAGLTGEVATYLVRSLLGEGRIRYQTVESTQIGLRPKLIEREGPTALLLTTAKIGLHPENETRLFSIPVDDSAEQTSAVIEALARDDVDDELVLPEFTELQRWLSKAEHRIVIPYAPILARAIPPKATRLRRDIGALFALIKGHAILHQASRDRDAEGRILATLDDYAAVHELIADLVAHSAEVSVPATVRETVNAVAAVLNRRQTRYAVQVTEVAHELGIDKSTASRRVNHAIKLGFLVNLEEHRSKPSLLQLGDPLPDNVEILPQADDPRLLLITADSAPMPVGENPPAGADVESDATQLMEEVVL